MLVTGRAKLVISGYVHREILKGLLTWLPRTIVKVPIPFSSPSLSLPLFRFSRPFVLSFSLSSVFQLRSSPGSRIPGAFHLRWSEALCPRCERVVSMGVACNTRESCVMRRGRVYDPSSGYADLCRPFSIFLSSLLATYRTLLARREE